MSSLCLWHSSVTSLYSVCDHLFLMHNDMHGSLMWFNFLQEVFLHFVADEVFATCWCCSNLICLFFPTCHVRVVRLHYSCSPLPPPPPPPPHLPASPPPPLHPLPCPLPPCQFFANLFANFCGSGHCRLPMRVGTAGPKPPGSERSGHR